MPQLRGFNHRLFNRLQAYMEFHKHELLDEGVSSLNDLISTLLNHAEGKEANRKLEHFNVYNDHVTIKDKDLNLYVEVYIKDRKLWCDTCKSEECIHVGYAWSIPKVIKALNQ